ncbi:sensor domain-containing diguanylate cyclase [Modicisalibacter tunisiensis]|uniref:diguanylate cyclase n=1 Tax=Modicisalibacter tunisiensis TaxID=390637 RepID=A0ABS7WZK4_9GAMM|nr:GGDEF domain-containing protein [Modicisalibacter tunisiensis]MBZ9538980.1 GGDEF domain-containing protein [Modicisalibacter tunisiensis]MBZ9567623.1 GGDEF domain-containing protein [Modicisalibacter tunisiensis]
MRGIFRPLQARLARMLPVRALPPERQRYFHTLSRLYLIAIITYVVDLIPLFWLLGSRRLLAVSLVGLAVTLVAREIHRRGYMSSAVLLLLGMMTVHMLSALQVYGSGRGFELYFALTLLITYISALDQRLKWLVSTGVLTLTAWQLVRDGASGGMLAPGVANAVLVVNLATVSVLFGVILRQLEGVTERLEVSYRRQANHDALTGVYNRRAALKAVERAQFDGAPFALLMLDIDHFKRINDTYGHKCGDRALCHVVECLRLNLRDEDMLGRYGGEEFIAVLQGMDREEAMGVARRLRACVSDTPYETQSHGTLSLTVSIGVAVPREAADLDALVALADQRLYAAKRSGRNRVCGHDIESPAAREAMREMPLAFAPSRS